MVQSLATPMVSKFFNMTSILFYFPVAIADTYYAIPYAAPPVKSLRFRRTQPVQPWKDTLDATKFGPACLQASSRPAKESEDCLTLNIWVPKGVNEAK